MRDFNARDGEKSWINKHSAVFKHCYRAYASIKNVMCCLREMLLLKDWRRKSNAQGVEPGAGKLKGAEKVNSYWEVHR